jgi:hypothetical protein
LRTVGHEPTKDAGLEPAVRSHYRALELHALSFDLEEHAMLLLMHSGAQLILKPCHLGEYSGDSVIHEQRVVRRR